jgi:hypothetical protein
MEAAISSETSALTYQGGSLCNQQEKVYLSLLLNFYIRTEGEYRPKIRYGGNMVWLACNFFHALCVCV